MLARLSAAASAFDGATLTPARSSVVTWVDRRCGSSSVPVTVGYLPEGASALQGQIGHVHISAEVRTAEWIRTAWQNLRDSPGFARIT